MQFRRLQCKKKGINLRVTPARSFPRLARHKAHCSRGVCGIRGGQAATIRWSLLLSRFLRSPRYCYFIARKSLRAAHLAVQGYDRIP